MNRPAGPAARVGLVDGLYAVVRDGWVAGFVVAGGRVRRADCAPILWRRLPFWTRVARPVPPMCGRGDRS